MPESFTKFLYKRMGYTWNFTVCVACRPIFTYIQHVTLASNSAKLQDNVSPRDFSAITSSTAMTNQMRKAANATTKTFAVRAWDTVSLPSSDAMESTIAEISQVSYIHASLFECTENFFECTEKFWLSLLEKNSAVPLPNVKKR